LDVGQGDAILINLPDRKKILIDAGRDERIIQKIDEHLSLFEKNIDLAVFSHPDADHIAGFVSLFDKYAFKNILRNEDSDEANVFWVELEKKIALKEKENKSKIYFGHCGDKISFSTYTEYEPTFYILNPVKGDIIQNDNNDNSLVLLLIFGRYSFLFTGDISKDVEKKILFNLDRCFVKEDSDLLKDTLKNLTVLKVSHHGSNTASSLEFLKSIKPEYSIISAGKGNSYGHPAEEVLGVLKKYSEYIFNTIEKGDINMSTNGENFSIYFSK
jgi:beta-lactamase superfamily II metal-dependent hydrolase